MEYDRFDSCSAGFALRDICRKRNNALGPIITTGNGKECWDSPFPTELKDLRKACEEADVYLGAVRKTYYDWTVFLVPNSYFGKNMFVPKHPGINDHALDILIYIKTRSFEELIKRIKQQKVAS